MAFDWIYIDKTHPVLGHTARELLCRGCPVTDVPGESVTHSVLPVPTRKEDYGNLQCPNARLFGGHLPAGTNGVDLLQDEVYLEENAAITAECALQLILSNIPVSIRHCPVGILGLGRIGFRLAALLRRLDGQVFAAERMGVRRGCGAALGVTVFDFDTLENYLPKCRVLCNTVPAPVVNREQAALCREDALLLDLASTPGIDSPRAISARGLPGKMMPEETGLLIARRVLEHLSKEAAI